MTMLRSVLLATVAILLTWSCAIDEDIVFDGTDSGSFSYVIDYSQMFAQDTAGMLFPFGRMISEEDEATMRDNLENEIGLTDVQLNEDTTANTITYSARFPDLDALNMMTNRLAADDSTEVPDGTAFAWLDANTLRIDRSYLESYDGLAVDDSTLSDTSDAGMAMVDMMKDFYPYTLTIHFHRPVASVNNTNYRIGDDGRSIVLEGTLFDVFYARSEPVDVVFD